MDILLLIVITVIFLLTLDEGEEKAGISYNRNHLVLQTFVMITENYI